MEWIIGIVIWGLIWGYATKSVILNRGYDESTADTWLIYGFLFGIVAFMVAFSKPQVQQSFVADTEKTEKNIVRSSKTFGILLLILSGLLILLLVQIISNLAALLNDHEFAQLLPELYDEQKQRYVVRIVIYSIIACVSFFAGLSSVNKEKKPLDDSALEDAILKNGGWRCSCGKVHYSYAEICGFCNKSRKQAEQEILSNKA